MPLWCSYTSHSGTYDKVTAAAVLCSRGDILKLTMRRVLTNLRKLVPESVCMLAS